VDLTPFSLNLRSVVFNKAHGLSFYIYEFKIRGVILCSLCGKKYGVVFDATRVSEYFLF